MAELVSDDDHLVLIGLATRDMDDARAALEEAEHLVASARAWIESDDLQVVELDHRVDKVSRGRSGVGPRQGGGTAVPRG